MKRYTRSLVAIVVVCFIAACSEPPKADEKAESKQDPSAGASFFSGARVIPGDGKPVMEDVNFIVTDGKITAIGSKDEVRPPKGAARIELTGRTVTPVFVNLHAHPGMAQGTVVGPSNYSRDSVLADLRRYEYYGIWALASLGSDSGEVAFRIREDQRGGNLEGSRLYSAGRGIAPKGGSPGFLGDIPIQVSTAGEARKAVVDEATRKVDLISIFIDDNGKGTKMRPDVFKAIIEEAHMRNLKVVAHVFALEDAKELVAAGVDGLGQSIRDREVDDGLVSAMKAKNVFLTPTLTALEAKFVYAEKPAWLGEQLMREVYPAQLSAYLADTVTMNKFRRNPELPALKQQFETAKKNLKKLASGGVKIGLGTDSGSADTYPGYFEIREMMLMAQAGLSPMDIITAATSVSASILGVNDIGTIAVGKSGNFLTFSNNPAEKMENIKDMAQLFINGVEVERSKLVQDLDVKVQKITAADRAKDAAAEVEAARIAAEAKLPHYGKFVLGKAASVRGLSVPTPKGSAASVKAGPPDQITVAMRASASDMRQFYAEALPTYRWKAAAGGCWERQNALTNKNATLCLEASGSGAQIQITEK